MIPACNAAQDSSQYPTPPVRGGKGNSAKSSPLAGEEVSGHDSHGSLREHYGGLRFENSAFSPRMRKMTFFGLIIRKAEKEKNEIKVWIPCDYVCSIIIPYPTNAHNNTPDGRVWEKSKF